MLMQLFDHSLVGGACPDFSSIPKTPAVPPGDDEGTELANIEDARREALETLGGIARDELPDGDHREFVIHVRHRSERVLTASLSLRVEKHA